MVSTVDRQRLESFKRKLTRLRKSADPGVADGLLKAGAIINAEQERLVPVDRGDLKESLDYELTVASRSGNSAVRIFTDDFKARWVEFGTVNMAAVPFFFVGYRSRRKQARAAISKSVRERVKKAVA